MSKSENRQASRRPNFERLTSQHIGDFLSYFFVFFAAIGGCVWVHSLTWDDLQYPWRVLDGDLSSVYSIAQALGQSWTGVTNNALGAPFRADFSLVFLIEDLHLVFIRVIAHLTSNPFVAVNAFYVLTFGFSAVSFLFVSIRMTVRRIHAIPLALSYAWLPYHFSRMDVGHVSLVGYYMLPLGILTLDRLFNYVNRSDTNFFPKGIARTALVVVGIVLIGSSGSYYGLFFALLTFSFLFLLFPFELNKNLLRRASVIFLVAIGFVLAPAIRTLLARAGGLEDSVVRNPEESVQFGGSVIRLLVPWGTWLPEKLRPAVSVMEYEWNATPLLGVTGVWLLLIGLGLSLVADRKKNCSSHRSLLYIFPWSLLFYTSGGLGLIFAYLIDPSFRAWNRFSIIILTLSLLAFGIAISRIRFTKWLISPALLVVAITTQLLPLSSIGIAAEPDPTSKAAYESLKGDAQNVEKHVASGCSILQLPIMLFPEGAPIGDFGNGEHLWLPLLTKNLHWSYGAGKGTTEGKYWGEFFGASPALPIQKARELGFCAVLVNFQSNLNRDEIIAAVGQPIFENATTGNALFLISR
jgi:phosphoglycerol transferase